MDSIQRELGRTILVKRGIMIGSDSRLLLHGGRMLAKPPVPALALGAIALALLALAMQLFLRADNNSQVSVASARLGQAQEGSRDTREVLRMERGLGRARRAVDEAQPQPVLDPDKFANTRRLVVSGRVIDLAARPVPGIRLQASFHDPEAKDRTNGVKTSIVADNSGHFSLWARTSKERVTLTLQIQARSLVNSPLEVSVGAEDVVVIVERANRFKGSLAYRVEGIVKRPKGNLMVFLERQPQPGDHHGESRVKATARPIAGQEGTIRNLDPGIYTLRVFDPGDRSRQEALVTVADLEVKLGETTRDPRVLPIDLTDLARRYLTLELRESDGSPASYVFVAVRSIGGASPGHWRTLSPTGKGRFDFDCPVGQVDIRAGTANSRVAIIRNAGPLSIVTLLPAFEVQLELEGMRDALVEGTHVQARLVPSKEETGELPQTLRRKSPSFVKLTGAGPHRLEARFEGSHQLELRLARSERDGSTSRIFLKLKVVSGDTQAFLSTGTGGRIRAVLDPVELKRLGRLLMKTNQD